MNTQEAIEFCKKERDKYYAVEIKRMDYDTKQDYEDVIRLLATLKKLNDDLLEQCKELNKFEKMWEELEREIQVCGLRKIFTKNVVFGYLLDTLKQKYFPKDKVVK